MEDEVVVILTQSLLHPASWRRCSRRRAILSIRTAYGQSQQRTSLASRKLAESLFEPDGRGYQPKDTRK